MSGKENDGTVLVVVTVLETSCPILSVDGLPDAKNAIYIFSF